MEDSKIFVPARHGLGDVLAAYFSVRNYGRYNPLVEVLPKIQDGLNKGAITSAMVIYESFYNASTGDVFRSLPFRIDVRGTDEFGGELAVRSHDNDMPANLQGYRNVRKEPPWYWNCLRGEPVPMPVARPACDVPREYVLFSEFAHNGDRTIADPDVYEFVKQVTGLPIVKVGRGDSVCPAGADDVDLVNKTGVTETAWLAKHARVVVAALTFFRVFGSLFDVPVIEVAQEGRMSRDTFDRTCREYGNGSYGIRRGLNEWFIWPQDRDRFEAQLNRSLRMVRPFQAE